MFAFDAKAYKTKTKYLQKSQAKNLGSLRRGRKTQGQNSKNQRHPKAAFRGAWRTRSSLDDTSLG